MNPHISYAVMVCSGRVFQAGERASTMVEGWSAQKAPLPPRENRVVRGSVGDQRGARTAHQPGGNLAEEGLQRMATGQAEVDATD